MSKPKSVTREQANEIIKSQMDKPVRPTVICYKGWWDIRKSSKKEIDLFILELLHQTPNYNLK